MGRKAQRHQHGGQSLKIWRQLPVGITQEDQHAALEGAQLRRIGQDHRHFLREIGGRIGRHRHPAAEIDVRNTVGVGRQHQVDQRKDLEDRLDREDAVGQRGDHFHQGVGQGFERLGAICGAQRLGQGEGAERGIPVVAGLEQDDLRHNAFRSEGAGELGLADAQPGRRIIDHRQQRIGIAEVDDQASPRQGFKKSGRLTADDLDLSEIDPYGRREIDSFENVVDHRPADAEAEPGG